MVSHIFNQPLGFNSGYTHPAAIGCEPPSARCPLPQQLNRYRATRLQCPPRGMLRPAPSWHLRRRNTRPRFPRGLVMWVFDTTLYQMYPLGMLDCPFARPPSTTPRAKSANAPCTACARSSNGPYLGKLGVGAILLNPSLPATRTAITRVTCAKSTTGWARTRTSPAWSTLYTHAASA